MTSARIPKSMKNEKGLHLYVDILISRQDTSNALLNISMIILRHINTA